MTTATSSKVSNLHNISQPFSVNCELLSTNFLFLISISKLLILIFNSRIVNILQTKELGITKELLQKGDVQVSDSVVHVALA